MLTLNQVLERIDISLQTIIFGSNPYNLDDIPQESSLWNTPVLDYTTFYVEEEACYKNYITVLYD